MNSPLHVHFINKNQRAFRSLLDQSAVNASLLTSGGDPNVRDHLGRTVLHLAASSVSPSTPDFVRTLLAHPAINLNLQDYESHWTALHRALWTGNLPVAILLLQRTDIDVSLKDYDGYTAFDVYNSTVQGTSPQDSVATAETKDLFIWGSNRNAALGFGDAGDRSHPEPVHLSKNDDQRPGSTRFLPLRVKEISMARLHTVVVTAETTANVRACGFGSGGRLAPGQHTQYSFTQLQHLSHLSITSVALGQDHSLALSDAGDVYSWGLNRFHQLGYIIEGKDAAGLADQIQATARKVYGALKKEDVIGVAACKIASACWTATNLYTWGTNRGQLGYPKSSVPIQVLPRKVAQITQPLLSVALSSTALCALLAATHDVLCLYNDTSFKVTFPLNVFPSSINHPYRPPATSPRTSIAKIICCEDAFGAGSGGTGTIGVPGSEATFAALGTYGDVFTWTMGEPGQAPEYDHGGAIVKPQRVWALRRQMSAVKDVAISSDGTILLCTQSGHVFTRSRSIKSSAATTSTGSATSTASSNKFHRVSYLNRVVGVCASPAGAFAALRVDAMPPAIEAAKVGGSFALDLSKLMTWLPGSLNPAAIEGVLKYVEVGEEQEHESDETEEDMAIQRDVAMLERMLKALGSLKSDGKNEGSSRLGVADNASTKGADVLISVGDLTVAAHSAVLSLRSELLGGIIHNNTSSLEDKQVSITQTRATAVKASEGGGFLVQPSREIKFKGVHPLTVLLFLQYLYTDEVVAIWDRRVAVTLEVLEKERDISLAIKPLQIKAELQDLAKMLRLPDLSGALDAASKRLPMPTLREHLSQSFAVQIGPSQNISKSSPHHTPFDVILQLSDCQLASHTAILRSRSPFFESFFDDDDWTLKRWEPISDRDGHCSLGDVLVVNLKHLDWKAMEFVAKFICGGIEDETLFDGVEFVNTVDEKIDHLFLVLAAANEFLLEKLILICSNIILKHVSILNVGSLLADATFFHAHELAQALQHYIAMNLESLLERGLLDNLDHELLKNLTEFLRKQQELKLPLTRSGSLVDTAMTKWADWLALQDLPQQYTTRQTAKNASSAREARGVPSKSAMIQTQVSADGKVYEKSQAVEIGTSLSPTSPPTGPSGATISKPIPGTNQTEPCVSAIHESQAPTSVSPPVSSSAPWRRSGFPTSLEKIDMRAIMASEAESTRLLPPTPPKSRVTGFQVGSATAPQSQGSPKFSSKLLQRDRRKSHQNLVAESVEREAAASVTPPRASSFSSGSPWKTVPKSNAQPLPFPVEGHGQSPQTPSQQQHAQPQKSSTSNSTFPSGIARSLSESAAGSKVDQGLSTPRTPTKTIPLSLTRPPPTALGPTITPVRALSSSSDLGRRRSSGPDVWSASPQPALSMTGVPGRLITEGSSFVAIQEQQRESELAGSRKTPKRSLLEIQEEEQARQVEAEFLSWWTMEEQRIKAEQEAVTKESQPPKPRKKTDRSTTSGKARRQRGALGANSGLTSPALPDTPVGPIPIPTPGPSTPNHSRGGHRPKPRKPHLSNTGS